MVMMINSQYLMSYKEVKMLENDKKCFGYVKFIQFTI